MRPHLSSVLLLALAACAPPSGEAPAPGGEVGVDSIVLQRGACYGYCPVYRLSLARSGAVVFVAREPGGEGRRETGTIAPTAFERLVREAGEIGFWELPDQIEKSPLCPRYATDHPRAIVTLYAGAREKTVDDYLGCREAPRPLRAFEERIDSVAGVRRWIRPGTRS